MKILFALFLLVGSVFSKPIILTPNNSVALRSEMDGTTVAKLMNSLLILDSKLPANQPIYLVISSPGGSINAGLELIDFARNLRRPVHTIAIFAASMAFIVHESLGTRYITHYGTLMAHKASGSFSGSFPGEIDSRYGFWLKRLEEIDSQIAKRVGNFSAKTWTKMYENEFWLNGFEAVNANFSDKIQTFRCHPKMSGSIYETISFFGFTFKLEFSECPLVTDILSVSLGNNIKTPSPQVMRKFQKHTDFKNWSTKEIINFNRFYYPFYRDPK